LAKMATIPEALARMASERRVIPFVGAGFSKGLGLPGWSDLLEKVADHLRIAETDPALTYQELHESANGDPLRIAEYLYLRAGSAVGPLRLPMTTALQADGPIVESASHVELINFGAPRVYTTNFDSAIENAYLDLEEPVEVVALSRDVATGSTDTTQVVKYHGDLGHDPTLVLTESQYYKRLDFESPMDLKFRSDLLGRSVLFIGYSFSDINIRVIWFKLMQMMRDVPERDRPPSYIVRLEPNPVLEALDENVGLRTIVLDPRGEARTEDHRTDLLAQFLADLADAASNGGKIPGTDRQMFVSSIHLDELEKWAEQQPEEMIRPTVDLLGALNRLTHRRVPDALKNRSQIVASKLLDRISAPMLRFTPDLPNWFVEEFGPQEELTYFISRALLNGASRSELTDSNVDWSAVWSMPLTAEHAHTLLRRFEREIAFHESEADQDYDIAYAVDLLKRFELGLVSAEDALAMAHDQLIRASTIYPAVPDYNPSPQQPRPKAIIDEINERATKEGGDSAPEEEAVF
jgi:SIR2-like domain